MYRSRKWVGRPSSIMLERGESRQPRIVLETVMGRPPSIVLEREEGRAPRIVVERGVSRSLNIVVEMGEDRPPSIVVERGCVGHQVSCYVVPFVSLVLKLRNPFIVCDTTEHNYMLL